MSRTIGQHIQLQYRRVFEVHSGLFSPNNARVLRRGAHFPRDRFGPPLRIVTSCTSLQSKSKFATYLTVNINGWYIDTYTCYRIRMLVHRKGVESCSVLENIRQRQQHRCQKMLVKYFRRKFSHILQEIFAIFVKIVCSKD